MFLCRKLQELVINPIVAVGAAAVNEIRTVARPSCLVWRERHTTEVSVRWELDLSLLCDLGP